ncbi:hypothetical protein [Marinomonas gallaica]|uniref:hypothetical protein n=1 Tax=Marinomonas gallaica TaxID=1806667 RepID=UPI00082EC835|nr:hypothetical protein [Marinomonas gallaica]
MPSSEIEVILPANGRGETRNFLLICAAIIATAMTLLSLIQKADGQTVPELPTSLSNMATQISNAIEEITLLEEAGMLSEPYQLGDLPLPALNGQRFQQQEERCFTLLQGQYLFIIERHDDTWDAHWAVTDQPADCHAPLTWHSLNQ